MKAKTEKLYNWAIQKANSSKAPLWIGFLFALEIFLFIPLDAILMFFCLQNPRKTFLYVLIAAFASTLSAAAGYLLGHFLWDMISPYVVPYLISSSTFDRIAGHLQLSENGAVFFGSLIPFPLKALSLISGVFHLALFPFLSCVLLARLLRFAVVGSLMLLWGKQVKAFIDRHFQKVLFLIGAKITLVFVFLWAIAR